MIVHSIRWRLQLWYGALLVLVLGAFGVTAFEVGKNDVWRRVDGELMRTLESAMRPPMRMMPPPGEPGMPPMFGPRGPEQMRDALIRMLDERVKAGTEPYYFVFWNVDGSVAYRSANAPAQVPLPAEATSESMPAGPGIGATRGRDQVREAYRVLGFRDCLLVGRSITPELADIRKAAIELILAGAAVLLVGLAGGWWVASRAIAPVQAISQAAREIAAGDLSRRIAVKSTEGELGGLAGVLNDTFTRLQAAFARQTQFTADASHELRTPLSVILMQTQSALSRERSAAEYRDALQACRRAAERMRGLTQSLLDLARLDAGAPHGGPAGPVDLGPLIGGCVELLRPLAEARQVQVKQAPGAAMCRGNAEQLEQVFTNLLANAIQFNRDGGSVDVAVAVSAGKARVVVADTGEGIAAEDLPHVFDRFYRADKSRTRAQGRTGLGLAIVKAIVEGHGGTVEASSKAGVGSRFTVTLPAVAD